MKFHCNFYGGPNASRQDGFQEKSLGHNPFHVRAVLKQKYWQLNADTFGRCRYCETAMRSFSQMELKSSAYLGIGL